MKQQWNTLYFRNMYMVEFQPMYQEVQELLFYVTISFPAPSPHSTWILKT